MTNFKVLMPNDAVKIIPVLTFEIKTFDLCLTFDIRISDLSHILFIQSDLRMIL
jgi:hypothetical protein